MSFYYDIIVNFQDDNYMFYEWEETDALEYIKKIPAFQVPIKVMRDLVDNNVVVSKEFLENIFNKTKLKKGTLEYAALFVSKNGAIVLEFASDGKSIARSYLQIADECHVLDTMYNLSDLEQGALEKLFNLIKV